VLAIRIAAFHLLLCAGDGLADHFRLDRDVFLHPEPVHHLADPVGGEDPHQVVLEGQEEARGAGVALAARPAAELVVDAPRLVALGADDAQATSREDLLLLGGTELP
jgi:hypothetical protein